MHVSILICICLSLLKSMGLRCLCFVCTQTKEQCYSDDVEIGKIHCVVISAILCQLVVLSQVLILLLSQRLSISMM